MDGRAGSWLYGSLTCFSVLLFSGRMVHHSLDDGVLRSNWTPLQLLYVICCTAVIHGGWVHRFVGVTAVLRSAVLL